MYLDELSDEQLMQSLQAGDQDAFTALYNRYYPALVNYLRGRIKRDKDLAEELVQDVFMRVNKHAQSFQPGQLVRPWLYTIADRLAINAKRNCARRTSVVCPDTDLKTPDTDEHLVEKLLSGSAVSKEPSESTEAAESMELLESLPKYVKELPRDLRRVVQFAMTNGAASRQAAKILDMPPPTYTWRMRKAYQIIRERIEKDDTPNNGYTLDDIHEGTIRDLIDSLPSHECDAVNRVVYQDSGTDADLSVVASVLGKLLGELVNEPELV